MEKSLRMNPVILCAKSFKIAPMHDDIYATRIVIGNTRALQKILLSSNKKRI